MSSLEILAIAPQLILSLSIVLQLLLIAIKRSTGLIQWFSLICLIFSGVATVFSVAALNTQATILFYIDGFSLAVNVLILSAAGLVTIISGKYLKFSQEVHDEYYVLLLLVTLGASILSISSHFASVFLGLELLSIALIGMVGYLRKRHQTLEAGFKYLILSATASSILLFGMALIYAYSGDMGFHYINDAPLLGINPERSNLLVIGCLLFISGLAFKLSLVPFHLWTPDVYQGAPAPVAMLLATVSKIAMFAVLIKFWFFAQQYYLPTLQFVITGIAFASMLVGNILALQQQNIKRLMAYSSIAHMGYLLIVLKITVISTSQFAWQSAFYYLFAYGIATLLIFTFICQISVASRGTDNDNWQQWQGLFWQSPWQAMALIVAFLSLAGIPLTAGFIGKFYLLTSAVSNSAWWLLSSLIVGSGIGLYYYLRIVFVMFSPKSSARRVRFDTLSNVAILGLCAALLIFGVLPDFLAQPMKFIVAS